MLPAGLGRRHLCGCRQEMPECTAVLKKADASHRSPEDRCFGSLCEARAIDTIFRSCCGRRSGDHYLLDGARRFNGGNSSTTAA
jgi:hypothetical protein